MLADSSNTPSGVIFDEDVDGELFGFRLSSSYALVLNFGVLVGAAAIAVTSCCRCVPGWGVVS